MTGSDTTGQGATPLEVRDRLNEHSLELGRLSAALLTVNQLLETADGKYQAFVDEFEVGLWLKAQETDGPRLPSEALRIKLARQEMPAELLGRRDGLVRKRERIRQRIGDVKSMVVADRSIVSALKSEMEAAR